MIVVQRISFRQISQGRGSLRYLIGALGITQRSRIIAQRLTAGFRHGSHGVDQFAGRVVELSAIRRKYATLDSA